MACSAVWYIHCLCCRSTMTTLLVSLHWTSRRHKIPVLLLAFCFGWPPLGQLLDSGSRNMAKLLTLLYLMRDDVIGGFGTAAHFPTHSSAQALQHTEGTVKLHLANWSNQKCLQGWTPPPLPQICTLQDRAYTTITARPPQPRLQPMPLQHPFATTPTNISPQRLAHLHAQPPVHISQRAQPQSSLLWLARSVVYIEARTSGPVLQFIHHTHVFRQSFPRCQNRERLAALRVL